MIYYVVPSKSRESYLESHFKTAGVRGSKRIMYGDDSIHKKYNKAIDAINPNADDIVVFAHDDVIIIDELMKDKLELIFESDDVGLVGIYGTTEFNEGGGWWMCDRKVHGRGHIIQGNGNGTKGHMVDRIGYFDDVVTVDGCFFAMRGELLNTIKFDENFNSYHFYDSDISLQTIHAGYDVVVADILIEHLSPGYLPTNWEEGRQYLVNKWKSKGYTFPLTKESMLCAHKSK